MLLKTLIGPIAAATIVNVFLFALAWRGHQQERNTGKAPEWLGAMAAAYGLAVAAFAYWRADLPAAGALDLFAIALGSEFLGAVIVYGLLWGFVFTRGKPWTERAWPLFAGLFLLAVVVGAMASV